MKSIEVDCIYTEDEKESFADMGIEPNRTIEKTSFYPKYVVCFLPCEQEKESLLYLEGKILHVNMDYQDLKKLLDGAAE